MMKSYTAYCMNEDGENLCMTREYTSKAHFISDLHGNGYKIHFVALTDKYDEECAKYYERLETKRRRAAIRRECEREWKRRDAEIEKAVAEAVAAERAAEEATEEPTQEVQTMRASREFFTLEEKTRKADNHLNIVADSDTEYYVTNAPSDKDAVKLAMIKYAKKLESVGTPAAALLASAIRDAIKYEYFSADCGYNYSGNGGGALEICTDYIDEKTTLVYLRVAEILEEGEEPEEAEEENQTEEKPTADSAFIAEMVEALKYFKRVLWTYIDGTRYERDIPGDFWGAHECSIILSFVNDRLKAQGAEPFYKLKNDFDNLAECFEEIMQKFEYGDERTIEEIISEYNFS